MAAPDLLDAYDQQLRPAEVSDFEPGARLETDGPLIRLLGQHRAFIMSPAGVDWAREDTARLVRRQREYFAERAQPVEWKVRGHDRLGQLVPTLLANGFVAEPSETVVIAPVDVVAAWPVAPPPGVTIRPVHEPADLDRLADLESRVWSDDWSWIAQDLQARLAAAPDRHYVAVAEAGQEVVAAGWLAGRPETEFGCLWGGSTLPPWRGLGIYRALVGLRAQVARRWGLRYLEVDASADSRPVLLRLGFVAVTTVTAFVWAPPPAR